MTRIQHNENLPYRCPKCQRTEDRWTAALVIFFVLAFGGIIFLAAAGQTEVNRERSVNTVLDTPSPTH